MEDAYLKSMLRDKHKKQDSAGQARTPFSKADEELIRSIVRAEARRDSRLLKEASDKLQALGK